MNLIFVQMKVYFELIDISEYQCSAYLHLLLLLLTPKVSLRWTLIKPFLNIILTQGLRILCLWLSILGSADVRFTQEPSNPSYFNNGSDANLVWDYTDPHNNIQFIVYSVLVDDTFASLIVNDSQGVRENPNIPSFYKGRVKIKGSLPWLSRTSTLETIPNLNVECGEAHQGKLKVQFSLLWQVSITEITIDNQTKIKCIQFMSLIFLRSGESKQ